MPQVLTTNAKITCPHGFIGQSAATSSKWSVNGFFVLLENDTGVLACTSVPPCASYSLLSMGLNASRIDGRKVVLVTDFNQTKSGLPLTMTETHPVIDNSTPTPIPPGQPAPPLSPEMADMTKPVVTCIPPALFFNSATMQPATLSAIFMLNAAHPLKWILTLLNEPFSTSVDLTNGLPPNLTVTPAGGQWNAPTVTITLTMTAAFMAALTPGLHHFFMIGVSQRGLSDYFEMVLTVS